MAENVAKSGMSEVTGADDHEIYKSPKCERRYSLHKCRYMSDLTMIIDKLHESVFIFIKRAKEKRKTFRFLQHETGSL